MTPPDPPAAVARLAGFTGIVTVRDGGETRWRHARANLPLPPGETVWVASDGQALLDFGAARIGLDGGTDLRLDAMDGQALEAWLSAGRVYLRLPQGTRDMTIRVHTARGIVSLHGAIRAIVANGAEGLAVSVLDGEARLDAPGAGTVLERRQAARLSADGDGALRLSRVPFRLDRFAVAMTARDPRIDPTTPDVAWRMTGIGDLAQYGDWQVTQEYGAAWVPRVATGWAPYRDGTWAWVAPWGWTWVDHAPWGFAPFHYGRWVRIGADNDWAWTPAPLHAGVGFQPVYAPALVAFLRPRTAGADEGSVPAEIGWFALAPGEEYRPGFPASTEFLARLNRNYVRQTGAEEAASPGRNRDAATVAPVAAMLAPRAGGHGDLGPAPPAEALELLPVEGLPLPGPDTPGVTRRQAERLGLAGRVSLPPFPTLRPAGAGSQRLPGAAPGPEIVPAFPGLRRAPRPR